MGRASIAETESFKEDAENSKNEERQHFKELLTCYYPSCLVGLFATVGIGTLWYVGPIWTVSSLLETSLGAETALGIASASQWVAVGVMPFVGVLCDRKGIAWVTMMGSALMML